MKILYTAVSDHLFASISVSKLTFFPLSVISLRGSIIAILDLHLMFDMESSVSIDIYIVLRYVMLYVREE